MSGRLLALDTGSAFGWAVGSVLDPLPAEWGSLRLATSSVRDLLGARLNVFDEWLADRLLAWGVTHVILAERFRSRTMGEAATNLGLDALVRLHAYRRRVPVLCQPEGTVRKEVLGRGGGPSLLMKQLALAWCDRQGIVALDDHTADACVLWAWAARELVATATTSSGQRSGKQPHMGGKKQSNNVAQKPADARLKAAATQV